MKKALIAILATTMMSSTAMAADYGNQESSSFAAILSIAGSAWGNKLDDDDWNNFGPTISANASYTFAGTLFGVQAGVRGGFFDLSGHEQGNTTEIETQFIATAGVFKHANPHGSGMDLISAGVVWDYMTNENYGEEHNETLAWQQIRGEAGFYVTPSNQIGLFGAVGIDNDIYNSTNAGPVTAYVVDHIGAFWQYDFDNGGHARLGAAYADSIASDFLITGEARAPLTDSITLFGSGMMILPDDRGDLVNGVEQTYAEINWSLRIGVSFAFGGQPPRGTTGPLLDVGHNGNFLISGPEGAL